MIERAVHQPSRATRRTAALAACIVLAAIMALASARDAEASYGSHVPDSDGYVPVQSTCYPGSQVGYYSWYSTGSEVFGTIYVNDCAIQALGGGPNDRARVIAHERGHALGLPHSSNPNSVMYPLVYMTGT